MSKHTFNLSTSLSEYSASEIRAELARRGAAAPAGFKLEHFCSCGAGCRPDDHMEEDCETVGFAFEGPSTYLTNSTGCQLSSDWTPEDGITFRISCHGYNDKEEYVERAWTREELEQLPKMVERVLSRIDYAEAKAFFEHNPKPFKGEPTLDDLYLLAKDNGLSTPSTFQAYVDLGKGEAK